MKQVIMASIGKKWKEWKGRVKRDFYKAFDNDIDRLIHRPERVYEQQWRALVYYWGTKRARKLSKKNKEIRANKTLNHRTGRKPFAVVREEVTIKNKGVPATRPQVWIAAYTKDGMPGSSTAAEVMNQMNELSTQMEGSSTQPAEKDEEIFKRVMGPERPGRVRTFGLGPSPTDVFGGRYQNRLNQTQLQEQFQAYQVQMEAKVKEMMEAMRTELQSTIQAQQVTIQAQQAEMEHLKSMLPTIGRAANGQVPDAASTHASTHRTSASGQPVSLHHQSHAFTSSYDHRPGSHPRQHSHEFASSSIRHPSSKKVHSQSKKEKKKKKKSMM